MEEVKDKRCPTYHADIHITRINLRQNDDFSPDFAKGRFGG